MTEQNTAPFENVGRGAAAALLVIPAAIIVFVAVAMFFNTISGFAAIVIPPMAAWLYAKGAGAQLTRAGWGPFVAVSVAAVLIGIFSGIVAGTYAGFTKVGGNGGLFGAPFLHTLSNQFTSGIGDAIIPILFGLALGAVAIVSVLRAPRTRVGAPPATPVPATPTAATPPVTPPAPPAPPLAPNQPSPGILLNGKPLDPDKK